MPYDVLRSAVLVGSLWLMSCLVLVGCGGDDGGGTGNVEPPKFSKIYDDILFPRCADSSCHGGGGGGAGKQDFTTRDKAYAALVSHKAQGPRCGSSGLTRVEPADPDASLLFLKISDTPPCGDKMPLGGTLSAEQIAMIKDWIAGGALDD